MEISKELVIEKITSELNECLESINAEDYRMHENVLNVDLENKTITIKFKFNVVEDDNYIGLAFY